MQTQASDTSPANDLCRACGLCCTGHLFAWVKLRPAELDPAEALGMSVFRSAPAQRGFNQPCPLWQGQCAIYTSSHYPHACRAYRCKLLKDLQAENMTLPQALARVEEARALIAALESLLPASPQINFRERVVALLEAPSPPPMASGIWDDFVQKAQTLLAFYDQVFGVNDWLESAGE